MPSSFENTSPIIIYEGPDFFTQSTNKGVEFIGGKPLSDNQLIKIVTALIEDEIQRGRRQDIANI